MKRFHEQGRLDRYWIKAYCMGNYDACVRYHLEARGTAHPDHMLPDGSLDKTLFNI